MSIHVPGFQSFFSGFLHHFVLAKLATSSIRVKLCVCWFQVWPGPTVWPDFTHPKARQYWTTQVQNYHRIVPIDGMWIVSTNYKIPIISVV